MSLLRKTIVLFAAFSTLATAAFAAGTPSPAGCTTWCAVDIYIRNSSFVNGDIVELGENHIFIEDVSSSVVAELRLEDTNPTFYALTYNALKDAVLFKQAYMLRVWYNNAYVGATGTYKKILQVGMQ